MRAFVFTDPALARQAGRFVWLSIDTEKAKNAPFRRRYPIEALPTFLILDPASETVALRWVGSATVPQLGKILDEGLRAARGPAGPPQRRAGGADDAFARAERHYGEGANAEAANAYLEALAAAPAAWPRYARAVESALFALARTARHEQAAALARDAIPRLRRTSSAANVAASGLDAALALPRENPQRATLVATLESAAREVAADPTLPVAADDRSGLHGSLVSARRDAGDEPGALAAARAWVEFLEGEAARAASPAQRTVFDSHRLSACLELGTPERAIPMLEASARDFPDDYNPPARLAVAYNAMKRWDEALAASDRALARAYGPRRLGIMQTRAGIFSGRGDTASARRTLEEAVAIADSLPPGQRSESTLASLRRRLEALK